MTTQADQIPTTVGTMQDDANKTNKNRASVGITPGPWEIHPCYIADQVTVVMPDDGSAPWVARDLPIRSVVTEEIVGRADFCTAKNGGWPCVDNQPEMLANARLIAAAPDLLEACQGLLDALCAEARHLGSREIPGNRLWWGMQLSRNSLTR